MARSRQLNAKPLDGSLSQRDLQTRPQYTPIIQTRHAARYRYEPARRNSRIIILALAFRFQLHLTICVGVLSLSLYPAIMEPVTSLVCVHLFRASNLYGLN
jgi:hypothetical protein